VKTAAFEAFSRRLGKNLPGSAQARGHSNEKPNCMYCWSWVLVAMGEIEPPFGRMSKGERICGATRCLRAPWCMWRNGRCRTLGRSWRYNPAWSF